MTAIESEAAGGSEAAASTPVLPILPAASSLYRASSRTPQVVSTNSGDVCVVAPRQPAAVASSAPGESRGRQRNKVAPGPIFLTKKSGEAGGSTNVTVGLPAGASAHERTSSGLRLAGDDVGVYSITTTPRSVKGRSRLPPLSASNSFSTSDAQPQQQQQADGNLLSLRQALTSIPAPAINITAAFASSSASTSTAATEQSTQPAQRQQLLSLQQALTSIPPTPSTSTSAVAVVPSDTASTLLAPPVAQFVTTAATTSSVKSLPALLSASSSASSDFALAEPSASTCTTSAGSHSPSAAKGALKRPRPVSNEQRVQQPPSADELPASCGCFAALFGRLFAIPAPPTASSAPLTSPLRREEATSQPPPPERIWSTNPKYALEVTPPPLMLLRRCPSRPRCQSYPTRLPSDLLAQTEQAKLQQLRLALRRSFSGVGVSDKSHSRVLQNWRRRVLGQYESSQNGSLSKFGAVSTTADLLKRMPTALRLHMQLPADDSAQSSPFCTDRALSEVSVV